MSRFCMGLGVAMGTAGLRWPGASADADCVLLWAAPLGVSSAARSAAACACVFLLALAAQALSSSNERRSKSTTARLRNGNGAAATAGAGGRLKVGDWQHLADSARHGLRILVAYLLMLAAMTYDAALLASIVAGFSAGFYWLANDTAKVPASADPCCA